MNTTIISPLPVYNKPARYWFLSFLIIAGLHTVIGWTLLNWKPAATPPRQTPAAIMVEFAPALMLARSENKARLIGPEQEKTPPPEPVPELPEETIPIPVPIIEKAPEQVETKPEPKTTPQPITPPRPEPLPEKAIQPQPVVQQAMAPPAVETSTDSKSAAPLTGETIATRRDSGSQWYARLVEHLASHRSVSDYPLKARIRRQEGVAYVRFVVNRNGKVLIRIIDGSSGFKLLDKEALALFDRSEPLPPPPTDLPGDVFELRLGIDFFITD